MDSGICQRLVGTKYIKEVLKMANSLKNITIPLTGSLNMNRNESLTDSSFSIFNKQNSPVFGGSISPLHYKLNGTDKAKEKKTSASSKEE